MDEHIKKSNYDIAKAEADIVDNEIIDALKQGFNFRVEAGAGSGKTYSLNRVIEWIQANKISDFNKKKLEREKQKLLAEYKNTEDPERKKELLAEVNGLNKLIKAGGEKVKR